MSLGPSLVRFISDNLIGDRAPASIDETTPLIDSGIIDSMGLLQIVTFIEERTGVRIPDDAVVPDNFQTVDSMERMVDALRSGVATD
ncbi:MAG: acyl carrier protein [Gemmatimonadaceae bacterium]